MTQPRNIAFLVNEFPLLSETFVISQMVGLMARGFDVSVVCDRIATAPGIDAQAEPFKTLLAKTRTRWRGAKVLRAIHRRLPKFLQPFFTRYLDALFDGRLNRFDLLIAHFGVNGLRLAQSRALGILHRPFFTVFHGYDVAIPLKDGTLGQYTPLFRSGQTLLPVSEYFRGLLIKAGAQPVHAKVLRMGVDCEAIPYTPPSPSPDGLIIVSVCRLVEKKGIEFAIRALGLLRARRPELRWQYHIIGDGPLRLELQRLAESCGVASHMKFLGPQSHEAVKMQLRQAGAFLLPSITAANGDMEGVPVALMEAMAAGLPVVSSHHSGIPELIADGESGLLAPEKDADILSQRLEWLADHAHESAKLTQAARQRIEASFNQTKLDDELAAMVHAAIAAERR